MARLESRTKMGYYPTPEGTLFQIKTKISFMSGATALDPCCGEGDALNDICNGTCDDAYGIELDTERAGTAAEKVDSVLCGSIFDAIVRPLGCFSMIYLNPPYDWQDGERTEFLFLKQAHKWLRYGGLLVYLVPEYVLERDKIATWIARRYVNIRICRFTREDYPAFRQAALFAIKQESETGKFPGSPYEHIEDLKFVYDVPPGYSPEVFELEGIRPEEIRAYRPEAEKAIIETLFGTSRGETLLSPLFPLRKGHLVSLLMSGVLNGELEKEGIVFKCFTERHRATRTEDDQKEITTDTYVSGIRVIERGRWFDVM